MKSVAELKTKIFADGADRAGMLEMAVKPFIQGLTTNPTLMRKAGIADYKAFAFDILREIKDKPISFEVFSDDFSEMERQALEIAGWGDNVYVKIPITNTKRESACDLAESLSAKGVKLNVTAIMTTEQVLERNQKNEPGRAELYLGVRRPHRGYRSRPHPADDRVPCG
jgi:transaldolase